MEHRSLTTIAPVRIPYLIDGKGYVLRKASYVAVTRYKSGSMGFADVQEDGTVKPRLQDPGLLQRMADLDCELLADCLLHADIGEDGRIREVRVPVSKEEIAEMPNDAVEELIRTAKDISRITPGVTREDLVKQMAELQGKMKELEESSTDPLAASPRSTTDGSVSPEPSASVIDPSTK